MTEAAVDFSVVAYREEGVWQVAPLPTRVANDLDTLVQALRPWPSDTGALGLVSVDEDFFIIVRVFGSQVRVLLSDITAATEWPIASSAIDLLELPEPDDDEEPAPAGDLGIVADLGVSAMDMGVMCDDIDLYPDEALSVVARKLGFEKQFQAAVQAVAV
ncbi:MAG: tRNA adenosine deaminase-associated protein [Nocardioidaceae bacterium]|nr:tRNA adenosine deaminase-associated protein [Nocardioidaceae bacterium]